MAETPNSNRDANWGDFDPKAYALRHFAKVSSADSLVAHRIIELLHQLPDQPRSSYTEIGIAGGALRVACLAEPVLTPSATICLTDVHANLVAEARTEIARVRQGESTIWQAHAADMAKGHPGVANGRPNPRWNGVLERVCDVATVSELDILTTGLGASAIRAEAHCLCSMTGVRPEYEQAVANFYAGMEPGDAAIRIFDINSRGYQVGGEEFPGYPITPDDVASQAERMGLYVVGAFGVDVDEGYTQANSSRTASTLTGIGGAVLLKPPA